MLASIARLASKAAQTALLAPALWFTVPPLKMELYRPESERNKNKSGFRKSSSSAAIQGRKNLPLRPRLRPIPRPMPLPPFGPGPRHLPPCPFQEKGTLPKAPTPPWPQKSDNLWEGPALQTQGTAPLNVTREIASTGHTMAHVPQSRHTLGSMEAFLSLPSP